MKQNPKQFILFLLVFLVASCTTVKAAGDTSVVIKTSVVCDMCKDRIERQLVFEKGVKEVTVNIEKKTVTVVYKTTKTNLQKIRNAIAKMGYRADNVPADPKGHKKLPECCKSEGCGKD
jgi:periplasmic mercuric ion binding protein